MNSAQAPSGVSARYCAGPSPLPCQRAAGCEESSHRKGQRRSALRNQMGTRLGGRSGTRELLGESDHVLESLVVFEELRGRCALQSAAWPIEPATNPVVVVRADESGEHARDDVQPPGNV